MCLTWIAFQHWTSDPPKSCISQFCPFSVNYRWHFPQPLRPQKATQRSWSDTVLCSLYPLPYMYCSRKWSARDHDQHENGASQTIPDLITGRSLSITRRTRVPSSKTRLNTAVGKKPAYHHACRQPRHYLCIALSVLSGLMDLGH